MKKFEIINSVSICAITFPPQHYFFGYYDRCPWDRTEKFMLALEVNFIDHFPKEKDIASIGLIDIKNNKFRKIAETRAWNWQQGCMLQWLPPKYERYIIYNDRLKDNFVSIILDLKTKKKKILPLPIYSIHPSGKYAITLNFSRLQNMRPGYGYVGVLDKYLDKIAPKEDGIYLLNLKTGKYKLIISLNQLYNFNHVSSMEKSKHWVNHLMFNPKGSRFCFFHRWKLKDGTIYTRLFTSNLDGSELYLLGDSSNYTHYAWRNSKELVCWGHMPTKLLDFRKSKLLTNKISKFGLQLYYYLFPNIKKKISNCGYLHFIDKTKIVNKLIEEEDGHCSFSPDGKWMITDTYPNKSHYRRLILYNFEKKKKIEIGRFYSLPEKKYFTLDNWDWSNLRCDLHPRWNRDGTKICIDSVHEGTRQMYIINVENIVSKFFI